MVVVFLGGRLAGLRRILRRTGRRVGRGGARRSETTRIFRVAGSRCTGADRLTGLSRSPTLRIVQSLLNRSGLVLDGIPDKFPLIVFFSAVVDADGGLIDRTGHAGEE